MKILVTALPESDWWGKGMPVYTDNWLMSKGDVPRPNVVRSAHNRLVSALKKVCDVTVLPFPPIFEINALYKHDFIFCRDSFINVGNGRFVMSNFAERGRQDEAIFMKKYLEDFDLEVYSLSNDAHAEGGEFYVLPDDDLLFAGVHRNNRKGVHEVAKISNIKNICIVESSSFHLDTNFCVLIGKTGHCVGVIACLSTITNKNEVISFCQSHGLAVLDINPIDGMGTPDEPGSLAVNSLALPGKLVGCAKFKTFGVEEKIKSLGIKHIVTPLHDLTFTAGGVHCLTNEITD